MQRPTERQVADWLRDLVRLLPRQNDTVEEASARFREMIPWLVDRYDSRDFTVTSREFVARHCTVYFPSYGQLCDLLDRWPRPAERPEQSVPTDGGLSLHDQAWVEFWHVRNRELAAQTTAFRWGSREADRANMASLIRDQSSKAWAVISGHDGSVSGSPTGAQLEAVRATVAAWDGRPRDPGPSRPFPTAPRPFRDVSLKGPELRRSRAERGITEPLPDEEDAA
jgi:hypothetical protein